jgi:hypothetical protein
MKNTPVFYTIVTFALLAICYLSSCKKIDVELPNNGGSDTTAVPDSSGIGLIGWYPFNSTGGEYSGTGNPSASIHDISSTPDRAGNLDGAYAFNGISSYISAGNGGSFCLNNTDFTINVWLKLASYGGANGSAIACKRGVGPGNGWMLSITNSSIKNLPVKPGLIAFIPGSTDVYSIDTTAIVLNKWYMITVMYNAAQKQCSTFINGKLDMVSNNIASPVANTTADLYVGRDNIANTSESYLFKGAIDDLRMYNRLLTLSELKKLLVAAY